MAGETALLGFFSKRILNLFQKEFRLSMNSFDTKILDFYRQFASLEVRLIKIEQMLDDLNVQLQAYKLEKHRQGMITS